jgi:hypothetical protein
MKNIIIVGGGWYGCHIASILKNKYDITIIEKNNDIFNGSSFFNQNRLHLGYHYCRNYATRHLCCQNYNIFLKQYPTLVDDIENNYYMISKDSILDFNTFVSIYKHEQFDFELIDNTLFENIDGQLIKVKEKVINSQRAYKYFKELLNTITIKCNEQFTHYTKENELITVFTNSTTYDCDILLDCTYNQSELVKNYIYELTCSLVYKKIKNTPFDAITIMDGKFNSLYPREKNKFTYTLTDVEFTPIISSMQFKDILDYKVTKEKINEIKHNMETKLKKYYPNFNTSFEYIDYFLSNKTKLISISDSRDITIKEVEKNVITVNCGKIYGIFEWEAYILKYIECIN